MKLWTYFKPGPLVFQHTSSVTCLTMTTDINYGTPVCDFRNW